MKEDEFVFRLAGPGDSRELTRLRMDMRRELDDGFLEEGIYAATLEYFDRCLADGSHVEVVCRDGGRIVGTVGLTFFEAMPTTRLPNGRTAKLMNMYVSPDHRHRGIARRLLGFALDEARRRSYGRVTLNSSPAGEALYRGSGFTAVEREYEMTL